MTTTSTPVARSHVVFPGLAGLLLAIAGCSESATVAPPQPEKPAAVAGAKTLSDEELCDKLDRVIELTRKKHLDPKVNNAWQIVHAVLAYGYDLELEVDGQVVAGLPWILGGGQFRGWNLAPAEKGLDSAIEAGTKSGPGHDDQWLGYMSQCGVTLETPLIVQGQKFQIRDLLTQTQWTCYDGMEATWTLMSTSTYLPIDETWMAKDGTQWNIERLLTMELRPQLEERACGGTHLLYGLTCAVNRYRREKGEPTGVWAQAESRIREAIAKAQEFQQPDGGFSHSFFTKSSSTADIGLRIHSTGHTLEFICHALPAERLAEPWLVRATVFLCNQIEKGIAVPQECGALYHAVHGLQLYREKRFGRREPAAVPSSDSPGDVPNSARAGAAAPAATK